MEWTSIILKLGAAFLAGGLVGLEREISGKAAGLRTNILICVGATTMSTLGAEISASAAAAGLIADPQRIGAGIITGIGFLGAGSIIQARGGVRGLTSAATIWVLASIGLAIGAGHFALATTTTFVTVLTLFVLDKVERRLPEGVTTIEYRLEGDPDPAITAKIEECARRLSADLSGLRIERSASSLALRFLARAPRGAQRKLVEALVQIEGIQSLKQG